MQALTKSDIRLVEWEFEFQQRDAHPVLMADWWARSLYHRFPKESELRVRGLDCLFTASNKGYVKRKQKQLVLKRLKQSMQRAGYRKHVYDATLKRVNALKSFSRKVSGKRLDSLSPEQLASLWKEFDSIVLSIVPWYFIPWHAVKENWLTDNVMAGLERHREEVEPLADLPNALGALVFPEKAVAFKQEQKAFFGLARLAQQPGFESDPLFEKQARKYLNEFSWMKTFVVLPIDPLSFSELVERVQRALNDRPLEEFRRMNAQNEKNRALAKKLLRVLKHDARLLREIGWSRRFAWLLAESVDQSLESFARLIPFYKKIASTIGIPYHQWIHLTSDEILGSLQKGELVSNSPVQEREQGFVFCMGRGKARMAAGAQGKALSDWIDQSIQPVPLNASELAGQPACPGVVRGIVRIALSAQESHALQTGEVLVCPMTSPDYLPAMKRAAAIVADEGGLLSHAAIISRELGKPCVIGTKHATHVLHNGDWIEVDAVSGTITILKKAKPN